MNGREIKRNPHGWPVWMVEEEGLPAIITLAVSLDRANAYGDMLTVHTGHFEHRSRLERRGAGAVRDAMIPTAPVWFDYEERPRGRVLYDRVARRVVVRADTHLHQTEFFRLISKRTPRTRSISSSVTLRQGAADRPRVDAGNVPGQ